MSNAQIAAALVLVMIVIYCGHVLLALMNFQPSSVDEQDKRLSKLKNDRNNKGLCIYCGEKRPDARRDACYSCMPDYPP